MSKEITTFQICVINYGDNSVNVFKKALPSDIQSSELEEILAIEGLFSPKDCYLIYSRHLSINIEV